MKIAYFDCFAGASGDMILAALVDAGLEVGHLSAELQKLHVDPFRLEALPTIKSGIAGQKMRIHLETADPVHRGLEDIEKIIDRSVLDAGVKRRAKAIFTRLAQAEARVHRTEINRVHFHEVGAMDAIIDVVGAVAGLDLLGVKRVYCSALHVGGGTVRCAHGTLPVPAPATAELIKGKPVYATNVSGELLTPTGAAILTTLATEFGPMPAMTMGSVGYGAGSADRDLPNLLRVVLGESDAPADGYERDQAAVIEAGIDDMNPQIYDHLLTTVLKMGAMDMFMTPVHMKKNRPGTLVTVICAPAMVTDVAAVLLRETTTIGLRWRIDQRIKARRTMESVKTPHGRIGVKVARVGAAVVNATPEYEECLRIARQQKLPLKTVMRAAAVAIEDLDFR